MIEINSSSLKDKQLAVADILDNLAAYLEQSNEISEGKFNTTEYITYITALRYAISYLRSNQ